MVWVKIPAENHPVFLAAVPKDPRVSTLKMFGGIAGLVNGHMFGGLFARSIVAKLSEADQKLALALDGSEPFDPMGNGRIMKDSVLMAEEVMDEPEVLRAWLQRAFDFTVTLPLKEKKEKKPKPAKAAKPVAKKTVVAKKPAAKKPAAKKSTKKSAAKPAMKTKAKAKPKAKK